MSNAVFEEKFIKLVEENGGFEYYQAYRGDVDLILGGKDNTYWYVVMKKGKVTESYIGKNAGGVWEDVYVNGSGAGQKTKAMPSGSTIRKIAERRISARMRRGSRGARRNRWKTRIRVTITCTALAIKGWTYL